ncbi:UPF0400 protein [Fulvia fulva]|uniref:UPF0400 protein n=1 Tax=Passalora fulva TaxID=5499 RepID=A0A9Q8P8W0_PASFU|nr:UPF0400 protein [Fulvia fulva]KAK4623536.1 UPF0400 protein [Fulvia fulva]KAK4625280.1 UPF0400 protein [Fulvia fulva]UJO17311.1 UPF0400 protein [Fulvia fulva]WPV14582.1 UPF0400 protein [Fulvia fulva]WPV29836.1 UPF0400 protein [Fulvia fulva]
MSYSDDAVRAKLAALNETQDSIVTNAQWIMFHRRHADRTAQLWLQRLQESTSASKRLVLLYLANEVVQQSRARSKTDFLVAFEPLIGEGIALAYKGASQEVQGKLRRVSEVWKERRIFDPRIQEQIENRLTEIDKAKGGKSLGGGARLGGSLFGGSGGGVATELEGVNKSQTALSKAEAALGGVVNKADTEYEKMTDPNAPIPSAPVRAAKLRGLVKDLMASQRAIETSLSARKDLIAGLEKLLEANRAKVSDEESKAADLTAKIDEQEATIRLVEDAIMRGASETPALGTNGMSNGAEPQRPETESFTPPPPDVEAFTPPPQAEPESTILGDTAEDGTVDQAYTNPTGADPIEEQPTNFNEPPPSYVPPPALPANDAEDQSAQADAFLKSLMAPLQQATGISSSSPNGGASGDPRLKRRKLSHPSKDVDDEIFGAGVAGIDEQGISAMLGQ